MKTPKEFRCTGMTIEYDSDVTMVVNVEDIDQARASIIIDLQDAENIANWLATNYGVIGKSER